MNFKFPKESKILQISAIGVAAPRYMGAFATAIGISLVDYWKFFPKIEIASGAMMAILEGWAIAYCFTRWRTMRVKSWQWKILLYLQITLMIFLPATATPYLISSQLNMPAHEILHPALLWSWSFMVAAIAPLVLAAVGYADYQPAQSKTEQKQISIVPSIKQNICKICKREFANVQGLNAHSRFCKKSEKEKSDF